MFFLSSWFEDSDHAARLRAVPFLLLLAAPTAVAQAPSHPDAPTLTLAQAEAQFRQKGFDLLISDAGVQFAEGDLRSNGALPAPSLSFSMGRTTGYDPGAAGPGASDRSYSVGISDSNALSDLLWGKRRLRARVSEAVLRAARQTRKDAERTLLALLKQQYLQATLAQLSLELSDGVRQSSQKTLTLAETRYKAGAVSEVDVVRARVAALEADQGRDTANQALLSAQANLAFMLGYRSGAPAFQLERRFEHPDIQDLAPLDRPGLIEEAKAHRPDLLAMQAQEQRAEAGLQLAKRNWAPDLTWSFGVSQEGTGQNALQPRTYTLGLSVLLPSIRHTQGEIRKAEADRRSQSLQSSKMEAQVALDVANAASAFESGRSRVKRMEDGLLASAQRAWDLVAFQYEKGATSLLDVLDAQRTYMATQGEYLQDLNDYWTARFQLDQALGKEDLP